MQRWNTVTANSINLISYICWCVCLFVISFSFVSLLCVETSIHAFHPISLLPLSLCSGVDGGDQLFLVDPPIEPIPTTPPPHHVSCTLHQCHARCSGSRTTRGSPTGSTHRRSVGHHVRHTKRQKRKRGNRNNHLLRYMSALDVIRRRYPLPVSFSPRCWYSFFSLSVGDEMRSERRIPKRTATSDQTDQMETRNNKTDHHIRTEEWEEANIIGTIHTQLEGHCTIYEIRLDAIDPPPSAIIIDQIVIQFYPSQPYLFLSASLLLCVCVSSQRLSAIRSFTTSRPVSADEKPAATPAAPAAVVAAPASSFSEIVAKYGGWYPFAGLAGVIAVSKEIIILSVERTEKTIDSLDMGG